MIKFKKITWEETSLMWEEGLPNMTIEPTSAMSLYLDRFTNSPLYDLENMKNTPTFWGAFDGDKLIGVNSGHMTLGRLYRSRGLYVKEGYRGFAVGQKLLMRTIAQARHENAIGCWSYPNFESYATYRWMQFQRKTDYFNFGYEENEDKTSSNTRACVIIDHDGMMNYHIEFLKYF
jgi:GNAT superfamily N-acetyltransferase